MPGYEYANWALGYGDFHLVPDLRTLRVASWLEKSAFVLCDVEEEASHQLTSVAPRSILRRQLARAAEMGYTAMAASELEYYIFADSYKGAAQKGYEGLDPAGFEARFGLPLTEQFGPIMAELEDWGLLVWRGGRLFLTDRGRLLSNQVFYRFLPE